MRRDLHWFKLWSVIGWLLIATVIYLSLTPHPIEIDVEQGDKIGHALAYFAMMMWFAQLYQRRLHAWWGLGVYSWQRRSIVHPPFAQIQRINLMDVIL